MNFLSSTEDLANNTEIFTLQPKELCVIHYGDIKLT